MSGRRRNRMILAMTALVVASLASATTVASGAIPAQAEPGGGLEPGQLITYDQVVPVNIVLVGYDDEEVEAGLLVELPDGSKPVVRYPQFYGIPGRDLGLQFEYDYNVVDAPQQFEDRFFGRLAKIGTPRQPTEFQTLYNEQETNLLDVTGPVLAIDGPATERYLEGAARRELGIDTKRSYTVFLVNWYGRSDFQFHVYTKTDEPDPDTGFNFGTSYDSRSMIAWGGTSGRTWFYDLSAGPEAWTYNWVVDVTDLDDNGVEDYRMPAIWEYTETGYRSRDDLPGDLGKVVRYVALDLLFTSSPLYDPLVTAPGPGGAKHAEIVMFEDDPASRGTDWIRPGQSRRELERLEPYHRWSTDLVDIDPIDPGAKRALNIFAELDPSDDCWTPYGFAFAQLFCYVDANRDAYLPPAGDDYVIGVFAFNTTTAALGVWDGLLGFADDNWVDGTQSYVFEFDTTEYRDAGYGFTTTTTHEVGHHLGLSHPHDGYDPETGVDYGPADEYLFVWSGDESDTVMNYLGTSNGFGAFDRENMARYHFAGYLNASNEILAAIEATGSGDQVTGLIRKADVRARRAEEKFRSWEFVGAAGDARQAYELVRTAADQLGVDVAAPDERRLAPSGVAPHEGDPIRIPDS